MNVTVPEPVTIPRVVSKLVPVAVMNPFNVLMALGLVLTVAFVVFILMMFPREAYTLLKARFGRKVPCMIADDSGLIRLELCEPGDGWLKIKDDMYPIIDTEPGGLARKRYILVGVKKPLWIVYETKALSMTPEHLKLLATRELADKPIPDPVEKKALLVLDPRDVRKDVKLRINKSILAYMLRKAEASGFEEARKGLDIRTAFAFAMIILAVAIAVMIIYGTLFGKSPPEVIQQAQQAVEQAKNITLG